MATLLKTTGLPLVAAALLIAFSAQRGASDIDFAQSKLTGLELQVETAIEGGIVAHDLLLEMGASPARLRQARLRFEDAPESERLAEAEAFRSVMLRELHRLPATTRESELRGRREVELKLNELRRQNERYGTAREELRSANTSIGGRFALFLGMAD